VNATGEMLSTTAVRLLLCVAASIAVVVVIRSSWGERAATRFGRILAVGSAITIGILLVQALVGVHLIGITNDEPVHVSRTNTWLQTRWYIPEQWIDADEQVDDEIPDTKLQTYGGAFSLTAHAVGVATGVEPLGAATLSSGAFAVRRTTSVMVGALGALAVGSSLAAITRRRSIGWWAAAATTAMPLWTGYSMFAVKDTPAATGYSLVTAGCILALVPAVSRRRSVVAAGFIAVGVWFGFGTRIGLWVPLFGTVLIALVYAWLLGPQDVRRTTILVLAAPAAAAALAVAVVHPHNARHPIRWLFDAAVRSADFDDSDRLTLTAGRLLGNKPPWWYLPAWTAASVPLILGTLAFAGVAMVAVRVGRGPAGIRDRLARRDTLVLFWVMQALALPVVAITVDATIYGGLRQHIYVLPAIAVLAAYGVHRLTSTDSGAVVGSARRRLTVGVVAALGILLPTIDQLAMNPYGYVYKNDLAGSIDDRWETDLHWASRREGLWNLPPVTAQVLCYRESTIGEARAPVVRDCTNDPRVKPFLSEIGRRAIVDDPGDDVWVVGRRSNGSPPLTGCEPAANVTRRLHGVDVTMSYVLRCDPAVVAG
jgi:hypothetical protein